MSRKILHLDLDAFFCAVEELHDSSLSGKPFAVGGKPDHRGVVASCSYAARRFGIQSAMPMARAVKICPQLIIISSHYHNYSHYSDLVMQRLYDLSPLVEQISIDEAFIEIVDLPQSGEEIARSLQKQVKDELSLPCSIGVASNKLVAKIANDVGKASAQGDGPPCAITVVREGEEISFLAPLPVERLWGVGPKTSSHLSEMGIFTIGDLANRPISEMIRLFGKNGHDLARRARGEDDSPIYLTHEMKSVSQETTFIHDISNEQELRRILRSLSEKVGWRLRKSGLCGSTIKIKLRWPDFTTLTRQLTLANCTDQDQQIYAAAIVLFEKTWKKGLPVRLIGVGVSGFDQPIRQLNLWEDAPHAKTEKDRHLQNALDNLRVKYGKKAVTFASNLTDPRPSGDEE